MSRNPKGSAVLSDEKVQELRSEYKILASERARLHQEFTNIHRKYGISRDTFSKIVSGKTYKWVA